MHGSPIEIARPEAFQVVFVVEPVPHAASSVSPPVTPAAVTAEVSDLLPDREALVRVDLGCPIDVEVCAGDLPHALREFVTNQPLCPAPVAAPSGVRTLPIERQVLDGRGLAKVCVQELAVPVPQAVAAAVAADVLSVMQDWVEALPVAVRPFGVVRCLRFTRWWREIRVSILPPGGLSCTARGVTPARTGGAGAQVRRGIATSALWSIHGGPRGGCRGRAGRQRQCVA